MTLKYDFERDVHVDDDTGKDVVAKTTAEFFKFNREIEYGVFTKLSFGKYKGLSIRNVFKQDPDYIDWLVSKQFNIPKKTLKKLKGKDSKKSSSSDSSSSGNFRTFSGVSFTNRGEMVDNADIGFAMLQAHLDEKHWDHAFDEEDMGFW